MIKTISYEKLLERLNGKQDMIWPRINSWEVELVTVHIVYEVL